MGMAAQPRNIRVLKRRGTILAMEVAAVVVGSRAAFPLVVTIAWCSCEPQSCQRSLVVMGGKTNAETEDVLVRIAIEDVHRVVIRVPAPGNKLP
jgi:hypothetical protein